MRVPVNVMARPSITMEASIAFAIDIRDLAFAVIACSGHTASGV